MERQSPRYTDWLLYALTPSRLCNQSTRTYQSTTLVISINQSINVYLRAGFYNKKSRISGIPTYMLQDTSFLKIQVSSSKKI